MGDIVDEKSDDHGGEDGCEFKIRIDTDVFVHFLKLLFELLFYII